MKGSWYKEQLHKTTEPTNNFFKIEKIIKQRTRNKEKEYLVKFLYYPQEFNEWIKSSNLIAGEDD